MPGTRSGHGSATQRSLVTTAAPTRCDIAVWYRRTDALDAAALAACWDVLSDAEQVQCGRFLFAHDRRDFAAAHALVRCALSRYADQSPADWRFEMNRYGKPAVVAEQEGVPPLAFNLSHTKGLVACAVTRGAAVGIDVECCERGVGGRDIASQYFAPAEIEQLARCPSDADATRFIELWTLKESYIKALGTGLSLDLHSFSFTFEDAGALRFASHDGAGGWHFCLAAFRQARLAVAVRGALPLCDLRIGFHDADGAGACGPPVLLRCSEAVTMTPEGAAASLLLDSAR